MRVLGGDEATRDDPQLPGYKNEIKTGTSCGSGLERLATVVCSSLTLKKLVYTWRWNIRGLAEVVNYSINK
jgi:hypothetical protein